MYIKQATHGLFAQLFYSYSLDGSTALTPAWLTHRQTQTDSFCLAILLARPDALKINAFAIIRRNSIVKIYNLLCCVELDILCTYSYNTQCN